MQALDKSKCYFCGSKVDVSFAVVDGAKVYICPQCLADFEKKENEEIGLNSFGEAEE